MKKLLLFAIVFAIGQKAFAQTTTYTPVVLTGFTADVIANGAGTVASSTSTDMDGASYALAAGNYVSPTNASPTTGLPNTGTIAGVATPAITYQLEPYTANNSLKIPMTGTTGVGTGTLTFAQPRAADQLYILASSGSGISAVTITVTFTDASTQVLAAQNVSDWFGGTGFAIQGISRVSRSTNTVENPVGNPRLYQIPLTISAANTGKTIQSVTFNKTSTAGVLNVFAITARFITPAMANDLSVTGVSGLTTNCGLTNQETIRVTINNSGTASQSNFPVSYKVNNGTPVTETFTGTIAPFGSATHIFTTKADLSATGAYRIQGKALLTGDGNAMNDTTSIRAINSLISALPITLDFETPATGMSVFQKTVNSNSNIMEATAGATTGPKVMVMEGTSASGWVMPAGTIDPWTTNPNHLAKAKICINPAGGNPNDPLWLSFDLKQLYKTANANTNFRITVNGTQVGTTYRPPFSGSPIAWQRVNINLTSYKTLPSIEIGFESSVSEAYNNGAGPANLIDNVMVTRVMGVKEDLTADLLQVFPNPSNGIFKVSATTAGFSLEVTDLTGKVILQENVKGNATELNLSNQAKGLYLVKVVSAGKTGFRKLMVE